ncbi:unnamed protein product [Rhizophagus irregularis]|nr:unnamed protein product [Rhizophagus irregularis]
MADFVNSDALYGMAKICKSLFIICEYSKENYGLNSLINAQRNLKVVLIYDNRKFDCKELIKALEKNGDTVSIIIPSIITSLINLKIDLNNVYDKDKEIIRQKIAISEFPDLQILNLKEISCFKELAKANNVGMLIETIAKHCPKIEELTTYLEPKDNIHVNHYYSIVEIYLPLLNSLDSSLNMNGDGLLDIFSNFSPESLVKYH